MKTKNSKPILPTALRATEIAESDVAVMVRVAQDKKAPDERYKRKPKRVCRPTPSQRASFPCE
jgi:hypothetical protein